MEFEDYMSYCTKCGWHDVQKRRYCPFCGSELKLFDCNTTHFFLLPKEEQEKVYTKTKDIISNSPDFDPNLYKARLEKERKDVEQTIKDLYSKRVQVTCPYCHSSNTRKIGAGERMFSANLFGLGSQNLGKQWHCKDCGSDF
ncbi:hypothetical protein [Diplocloster agilis]|uniref:hypothetical protein n=1 Tax=Diplocloster agilis TaxID=2850323 RepID=UPI000821340B|nr:MULTISPECIES: hypothetical protein [Lachnospiraceae]MBU9745288.1 hypothetical protein [Diplocloster agilis]MCU6733357.1 hypothetical protein [Suonthocola fibrivorans]SCI88587.1 Uncharacterised protein [uncultured Clostridium sp.]